MKLTDSQFEDFSTNLTTLAQVDLSENDPYLLRALAQLLSDAALNVAKAIHVATEPAGDPLHVGARVVVIVAGDMFTGRHATVRGVTPRPHLKRTDYTLDIDDAPRKHGAGPYQAREIAPDV